MLESQHFLVWNASPGTVQVRSLEEALLSLATTLEETKQLP